jgi:hypothetical protein
MKYREAQKLNMLAAANPVPREEVASWATTEDGRKLLAEIMHSSPAPNVHFKSQRLAWRRMVIPAILASLAVGLTATTLAGLLRNAPEEEAIEAANGSGITLESLSRVAAEQTLSDGPTDGIRYTKSKTVTSQRTLGASSYTILIGTLREAWVLPDGSGKTRSEPISTDFPSEQDRKAWEASGSPMLNNGKVEERTYGPGQLQYEDYAGLPIDPDQLISVIRERAADSGPSLDAEMFILIGDLLRGTHVPAELRASLFRVAARIPGVKVSESVADPEGRHGVAATLIYDDQNGSLMEVERIFDKDTTQLMAETQTILDKTEFELKSPPPGAPRSAHPVLGPPTLSAQPGHVVGSTVYLSAETVSSVDETP